MWMWNSGTSCDQKDHFFFGSDNLESAYKQWKKPELQKPRAKQHMIHKTLS